MSRSKRQADRGPEVAVSPTKRPKVSKPQGKQKAAPLRQAPLPREPRKSRIPAAFKETETDSDPIVESDTTSQSGEDDGVSWPSDDEDDINGNDQGVPILREDAEVSSGEDGEDAGGVKLHPVFKDTKSGRNECTEDTTSKSRESHAKQKVLTQERKAAKPNADFFIRAKKIWERLRRQSHVPKAERKKLVAELFEIITGRVKDFVLKHDAGRVVQTGLKYGNLEQRKLIAKELKGHYVEMASSKFAKHTIGKVLVHGDREMQELVIPEFYGNVRKMIRHPEAAWILDDVYRGAATPKQKTRLLREWYGAEYALFKADANEDITSDLSTILQISPEKRGPILKYLFDMINQLIQKKTIAFTILHDAMLQYYLNVVGTDSGIEFLETIMGDEEGDLLKNLAFTQSGSRLVCLLFAHGNAKDRKLLLRAYKGVIQSMAFDEHAHKVLLVALDVIDDTKLTSKAIYGELLPAPSDSREAIESAQQAILDYAFHLYGRSIVLYPFAHKLSAILPQRTENLLKETNNIRANTSKKNPQTRRTELAKTIAPQLLAVISNHPQPLLRHNFGCQLITDILLSSNKAVIDPDMRKPCLEAIIHVIALPEMKDVMFSPFPGRMLKSLVCSGYYDPKLKAIQMCSPPLGFADTLFAKINAVEWACGANSFVIVGLLDSDDFTRKDELREMLSTKEKVLQKAASDENGKENKGTQVLLEKIRG